MDNFIQNSQYRILICKSCQIAVFPIEMARHLKDHHHQDRKECQAIAREAQNLVIVIQSPQQWALEGVYPRPNASAVFGLKVHQDGFQCLTPGCCFVGRNITSIKEHCRTAHCWVNPYGKGGSKASRQSHKYPWRFGVSCQQFFNHRAHQNYFAVVTTPSTSSFPPASSPAIMSGTQQLLQQIQQRQAEITEKSTVEAQQKLDANPWLNRTGWARHLEGITWDRMAVLIRLPQEEENTLQIMYQVFASVVRKGQEFILGPWCPFYNRIELNRVSAQQSPSRPFEARMEPDTLKRYTQVWQRIIGYIYRTFRDDERRYEFTPHQATMWEFWVDMVEELNANNVVKALHPPAGPPEEARTPPKLTALESAGLRVWLAWLDDSIGNGEYENPLVSATAILGYDAQLQTWVTPLNYTPKLSAIIKLARILIAMYALEQNPVEPKARLHSIRKQMTRFGGTQYPSPLNWCMMLRTYGQKIRYTTTAEGSIRWDGETISHRRTRFSMHSLRSCVHGLFNQCRHQLLEELLYASTAEVPAIPWASLEDFPAEQQNGFSFLQDPRTQWPVCGEGWLFSRLIQGENQAGLLGQSLIDGEDSIEARGWHERSVKHYMQAIATFKESLVVLVHLTSGQPARGPELLSIRYCNTAAGGTRNIFIEQGQVALVTAYHKGYQVDNSIKIIHRYLPREVSELLIWYLWLVQPFQRQLEVAVCERMFGSGKLWEQGAYDRIWTSDRIRRRLEEATLAGMGVSVNISTYRQIAIAIARRYLKGEGFIDDRDDEEDVEDDDTGTAAPDHTLDAQAGHTTYISNMIYARAIMEGPGQTKNQRTQFLNASQAWHRFLEFPSAVEAVSCKRKWVLEEQDACMTRWKRMRHVNVQTMLQRIAGSGAEFRGIQAAAISAVQAGVNPIVAVMGTGGGKSLLFMVPALCAAQISGPRLGTTVVIVPTISLREDLLARCQRAGLLCTAWNARSPNSHSSIMLVTPEGAVSHGFQDYLNRLKATQQLDRLVIDECHVVLDNHGSFRPKIQRLHELWGAECQILMLTATLPPREFPDFCQRMCLPREAVQVFRSPTGRPNIRYSVQIAPPARQQLDIQVVEVVRACQQTHVGGKIIVYSDRVARVQQLALLLDCPAYFRDVEGKSAVFSEICGPTCTTAVATNALGVGVDIANIRAVIHADGFRHLRDFAQESGRAGRDGQPSDSIVIAAKTTAPSSHIGQWIGGDRCCRVVLGEYLDGDFVRQHCHADEEPCWVCSRPIPTPADKHSFSDETTLVHDATLLSPFRSSAMFVSSQAQTSCQQEGEGIEGFAAAVRFWEGICPVCRMYERASEHLLADCPHSEPIIAAVQANVQQALRSIRYAPFSACMDCGQPQWVCLRFEDNGQGGWRRLAEDLCDGHGVVVAVVIAGAIVFSQEVGGPLLAQMEDDSVDVNADLAVGRWLGGKIIWSQHEAARIHPVFWRFHLFFQGRCRDLNQHNL